MADAFRVPTPERTNARHRRSENREPSSECLSLGPRHGTRNCFDRSARRQEPGSQFRAFITRNSELGTRPCSPIPPKGGSCHFALTPGVSKQGSTTRRQSPLISPRHRGKCPDPPIPQRRDWLGTTSGRPHQQRRPPRPAHPQPGSATSTQNSRTLEPENSRRSLKFARSPGESGYRIAATRGSTSE